MGLRHRSSFVIAAVSLALVVGALLLASFGMNFSRQQFHGIEIGERKTRVVELLRDVGIWNLELRDARDLVITQRNLSEIDDLARFSGVCATDNKGFSIKAAIQNGHVTISYTSVKLHDADIPSQLAPFFAWLREQMIDGKFRVATNCIAPGSRIDLRHADSLEAVLDHPVWVVFEPESYSYATLTFEEDRLVRITYHWRPFETM